MRKMLLVVAILLALTGFTPMRAAVDKYYTLSATVTLEPGQSVNLAVKDGLLKVDGLVKPEVPAVVGSAPEWLISDLELAFAKLAKAPDRIGKDAYITCATFEGKEVLVISSTGKKPIILTLPDYGNLSGILPASTDMNARIAIADIDSDGNPDLVVCPKNGGYYYLLGPDFAVSTKQGNVSIDPSMAKTPMYPITSISGNIDFKGAPEGFGYFGNNGDFMKFDQSNFVMPLPSSYGAMTSMGLFYIDGNGDLRLFDKKLTGVANPVPTGYSAKTESGLPSFDGEVHMAFDKGRIVLGTLDGDLLGYTISKGEWKKSEVKTGIKFAGKLSIQISDGKLYYLDASSNKIKVTEDSGWSKSLDTNATSDAPFAVGDVDGDKIDDMAVVSGSKINVLSGPDFTKPIKTIEEWIERKKDDKETEKIPVISKSSSPAFGDVDGDGRLDLLVGDKDGRIATYLGPMFKKSDTFDWLDVGDYAAPQFGDADGDGNPELLISNVDGRLFCYKHNGSIWQEWKSWSFIPTLSQNVESDYYNSYMHDAPLVQWKDDPEVINAYVSQLENCNPKWFDEIAFVIANTSPEILRTMARMGQADIVTRNAKTIYDYAPTLPYLKLVEKSDYTTIVYNVGGKDAELPRDDYYWYVVHPRILFELPIGINCSWWDKSQEDYGISIEDWWKHEENFYLGRPVFWREAYKDDKTYGESVLDAAKKSKTYEEAMANVFWLKGIGKDRLFTFGYLTNDLYPWQIYKKHYGSCGENSIVFASMARAALLPCYVAIDQGEDHQWNEVWMPDGWRHLEPSSESLTWDVPWIPPNEGRNHDSKTISAIVGWRGDDYMFATTTSVHVPESDRDYTKSGKGYTDTADVTFRILDAMDKPVEGGLVIIRSGWNNSNNVSIWGYTDINGKTRFDLGYEPYYVIDVVTPYGITGLSRFVVKELGKYEVTLKVPGKSEHVNPVYSELPSSGTNVLFESIKDEQRPMNFRTSRGYRLGGYLFDTYGHHGPLFFRQPIPATPVTVSTGSGKYQIGAGKNFGLGADQTLTISNDSLYTWKTVTVKINVPVNEYRLSLNASASKTEVNSGESFEITGKIDHSTPLVKFETSWDGKVWRNIPIPDGQWFGEFKMTIETGESGPMSLGGKKIFIRCSALNPDKNLETTIEIPVKIVSTNKFPNQPIYQDGPDPVTDARWRLVDFTIPDGEKYLLIQTDSKTPNLDLDMFLYLDSNGNGKVDKGEDIANSAGGSAFERILLQEPKKGPYILIIHGYSVPDDSRFDLKLSCAPNW